MRFMGVASNEFLWTFLLYNRCLEATRNNLYVYVSYFIPINLVVASAVHSYDCSEQ